MQVEVKIRFLLVGKTNVKPDKVLLDIAENILLKGMEANVQSSYLQIQYIIFLTAYRENFEQSKLKLDDLQRTVKINLGMGYSIFRKLKDLDKLRQDHEDHEADYGFEEMQQNVQLADKSHEMCKARLLDMWMMLRQLHRGADLVQKIASLLEVVADSEKAAQEAFIYVLDKCKDAEDVYRKYAVFVREIQDDAELALRMKDRAEELHTRAMSAESKSQASSSRPSSGTAEGGNEPLKSNATDSTTRDYVFTLQLRIATGILLAVIIALFVSESLPPAPPRVPAALALHFFASNNSCRHVVLALQITRNP